MQSYLFQKYLDNLQKKFFYANFPKKVTYNPYIQMIGGGNKDVIRLTKDNFFSELERHNSLVIKFYAPWCGHCKTLEPIYKEASNKTTHQFAEVNCDDEPELARMCNIEGFPTIKKLSIKEFKGDRNVNNLIAFAESKL